MPEQEQMPIKGPFGLWPYPILNVILLFILALTSRSTVPERRSIKTYQFVRDEKGRIIEILEIEK
jgi:hypothetical protein